ncbi:histidine phosphatase family protein [Nocardioides sp.]|uniref:histidine phosphatase family protein n=1 Tax=Nocardioides sp. TaxID=35761 RepID=UPI002734A99C|nr:histidine phosphatase family protein [Nocardioides sp.]MDP3892268.1 histidine phosphatase family protein [Nocardioides sp.]
MSVLLLVRHGQASFGARDYDALSDVGHEQSRVLGRSLAERGIVPDLVLRGDMRRHRETAEGLLEGAGWDVPVDVDGGWDEFDHEHVIEVHRPAYRSRTLMAADLARTFKPRKAFQELFDAATARWLSGEFDHEYHESWPVFVDRVGAALERTIGRTAAGGVVLVVSSGGPIGLTASHLIGGDAGLWPRLNTVCVNTGVTKVVVGSQGLSLVSFNSHGHVERDRRLLTYR